jgi:excisionase family DNA binding protein
VPQERLPLAATSGAESGTLQPLLTDRDVAAVLAVRPDTVRRWAASGLLPSVRLGGRLLRFRAEDVQQWIQGQSSSGHLAQSPRRRSGSIRSIG